jgi:WD40 repeat protein
MPGDTLIDELLCRYESACREGPPPAPEDLCRDHPELLDQLRRELRALESVNALLGDGGAETDPAAGGKLPVVSGYEVLGVLGRGGMGVVYKAWQLSLGRAVALKMILAGAHASPGELARFRAEADALARLRHPNIIQIHDVGEYEGRPYLALEYVEGGSLKDRLGGTPLPPRQAAALVQTLAGAVQAAHGCGIVHRDLKPGNVLLAGDGTPKITDFGLAKRLDAAAGPTRTGSVLGTPAYMAPEQAGGQSRQVGPATDVYALGALLYELLAGRPPFRADTSLETLRAVVNEDPVPLRKLVPRLPRDLETVCLTCLHKEPGRRYASAAALADDLGRFLAGEPVRARTVPAWERAYRWSRRRPGWAALLGVGLLAVAAVAGLTFGYTLELRRQLGETDRARAAAQGALARQRRHLYAADMAQAWQLWQKGELGPLQELLDRYAPGDGAEDLRRFEWHYLARLARSGEPATVLRCPGELSAAALSADGGTLAAGQTDGTVQLWDVAAGEVRLTLTAHPGPVGWLGLSRDGTTLASAGADGSIRVWDAARGEEWLARGGQGSPPLFLALAPDGRALAAARKDRSLTTWDLATRASRELARASPKNDLPGGMAFAPDGTTLALASASGDSALRLGSVLGLYDVATGQFRLARDSPGGPAILGIPDPGGGLPFAAGDAHGNLWFVEGGRQAPGFRGHAARVRTAALSPDGITLATAGDDTTIRLWDRATGSARNVLRGHTDRVWSLAFTADGTLVSVSRDRTVRRWHPSHSQERRPLEVGPTAQGPLAFSPDGRLLAVANRDRTVTVWQVDSGRAQSSLLVHTGAVCAIAFSPDGATAMTASEDGTVRLWDPATGRERARFVGAPGPVVCAAFSPDGALLASAGTDRRILLCDATTGTKRLVLTGHADRVTALAFSPGGQALASGARDGEVRLWDPGTGSVRQRWPHAGEVRAVTFSRDGRLVAVGAGGGTVTLWGARAGGRVAAFGRSDQPVRAMAFSPDGATLAAAGEAGVLALWDVAGRRLRYQLDRFGNSLPGRPGPSIGVLGAAYAPDGPTLAVITSDGIVRLWDMGTWQMRTLAHPLRPVQGLAFSPDGRALVIAADDGPVGVWSYPLPLVALRGHAPGSGTNTVALWDVASGELLGPLAGRQPLLAGSVTVSAPGRAVAAGTEGGVIWQWDADTRRPRADLFVSPEARAYWRLFSPPPIPQGLLPTSPNYSPEPVRRVAFSPDGSRLAAAVEGRGVVVLDPRTGQGQRLPGDLADVTSITFSPDGALLAAGRDGEVRLWDVAGWRERPSLRGHQGPVCCLAFSPDGAALATGGADGQVKLWDPVSGRPEATFLAHPEVVTALAFSPPDGRTLATGGADGTIKLWSVTDHRELASLGGDGGSVSCLAFSPDGKCLASGGVAAGGSRGEVYLWEAGP